MYDEHISFDKKKEKRSVLPKMKIPKKNDNNKEKIIKEPLSDIKPTFALNFNFKKAFQKFGILVLFAFAFIFITTKLGQSSNSKVMEKNLEAIKNGAYQYFKENNRPLEKDEEYTVTLQDLIDDNFVEPIKNKKGTICDANQSEVTIAKNTSTKYLLSAHLSCDGNEMDKEFTLTYAAKSANSNASNVYYKLQKEVITDNYQYSCPNGYILSGKYCYTQGTTLTTSPIARYKTISEKKIRASYKKEEDRYIYVEPIISTTKDEYYCTSNNATLVGTKCMITKAYTTKMSCLSPYTKRKDGKCYYTTKAAKSWSSWAFHAQEEYRFKKTSTDTDRYDLINTYQKNGRTYYEYNHFVRKEKYTCAKDGNEEVELKGHTCYHYSNINTTKVCSSGYQLSEDGAQCIKYTDAKKKSGKTTYICPTGYQRKGSKENMQCYIEEDAGGFYYCKKDGYRLEGEECVRDASTELIGYKCPSGYQLNGNQCIKTLSGDKISATKTNDPEISITYKWSTKKSESGWTWTGETKNLEHVES